MYVCVYVMLHAHITVQQIISWVEIFMNIHLIRLSELIFVVLICGIRHVDAQFDRG